MLPTGKVGRYRLVRWDAASQQGGTMMLTDGVGC